MNFIVQSYKMSCMRVAVLSLLITVVLAFSQSTGVVRASDLEISEQSSEVLTLSVDHGSPHPNGNSELPWLFAVFIVTWAAFFAYSFVISRRQREIWLEIDDLKKTLRERQSKKGEADDDARSPSS